MDYTELWPGWKTVEVIGKGAYGSVYKIEKTDAAGTIQSALKVVSIPTTESEYSSYLDDGYTEAQVNSLYQERIDRMVGEFSIMSELRGLSNIVSYEGHEIRPHENGHGADIFIKMELLESLPRYLASHEMGIEDVIELGCDICRALEKCEKKNIVHRDIKPQNIFVNDFDDFKLGDFGIARVLDHSTHATKAGTNNYMAPEIYRGSEYDGTVDFYSLGIVLYWLLNNKKVPFLPIDNIPTAKEETEALSKRLKGEPFPPTLNGNDAIDKVIAKACSADPSKRYRDAKEFRRALEECRGSLKRTDTASQIPSDKVTYTDSEGTVSAFNDRPVSEEPVVQPKKHYCPDCGKEVYAAGVYCADCEKKRAAEAERRLKAEKERRYYCRECGKEVYAPGILCADCEKKLAAASFTDQEDEGKTVSIFDDPPRPAAKPDPIPSYRPDNGPIYSPKSSPKPGPKQTTYYCPECGKPVAKLNELCADCVKKLYLENDTATCPHCKGSGKQTFIYGTNAYYENTCGICAGKGRIPKNSDLFKTYAILEEQARKDPRIDPKCPVCQGYGKVIAYFPNGSILMKKVHTMKQISCPACIGKTKLTHLAAPPKHAPNTK